MGKTAISILSESLQLPPNNEFATEECHFLTFEGTATASESPLHSRCHQRCSRDRMQMTYFSFYDHDATQSECAHRLL